MENKYFNAFLNLLPKGPIWEYPEPLYAALAKTFQRVENWLLLMLLEINPATTISLLARWEHIVGLPDECSRQHGGTVQERKNSLFAKLNFLGRQDKDFYKHMAKQLGYDIEITEYKPFVSGLSTCGEALYGTRQEPFYAGVLRASEYLGAAPPKQPDDVRYFWKITVLNPSVTYFQTGVSACGERLVAIQFRNDLECRIRKAAQSHTQLTVAYDYEMKYIHPTIEHFEAGVSRVGQRILTVEYHKQQEVIQ